MIPWRLAQIACAAALSGLAWVVPCDAGFGSRTDVTLHPSGSRLRILLADVDLDGYLDLIVTSVVPVAQARGAIVLRGDGMGGFTIASEVVSQYQAMSLACGEFDSDAHPDLALLTTSSLGGGGYLELYHGSGNGTFGGGSIQSAHLLNPNQLEMADLNGDDELDLVVLGDFMCTFLGDGQGGFMLAQDLPDPGQVADCEFWDINGDGKLDIICNEEPICCAQPTDVTVRHGNGDGTFGPVVGRFPTGHAAFRLKAVDLNGDGYRDLAISDPGPFGGDFGSALVMLGGAGGTFGQPAAYGLGRDPFAIVVADFDRDGANDAVLSIEWDGKIAILPGRGDGTFGTPTVLPTARGPQDVAVGDLNGDGWLDLAVGCFTDDVVSVFLNDGLATPVLASLVETVTEPGRVVLVWSGQVEGATVHRRAEGGVWAELGEVVWDGLRARFEDRSVQPGMRYAYRLGLRTAAGEAPGPSVWVDVPTRLSLAVRGGPSRHRTVAMEVDLLTSSEAVLETFDLQGRRIERMDLPPGNAGTRHVELAGTYRQGVYLAHIRQGDKTAVGRLAIVR